MTSECTWKREKKFTTYFMNTWRELDPRQAGATTNIYITSGISAATMFNAIRELQNDEFLVCGFYGKKYF
jgi:hypothetical protein